MGLPWMGSAWHGRQFSQPKEFTMEIRWKQGSQHKVEAAVAHEAVEAIRKRSGGDASAEQVVKAAASKRNPLHPEFTWDDNEAANEYRLDQARRLLRELVVVRPEITTDRPQRVYGIVRVPREDSSPQRIKHVYRTIDDIMRDPDTRAEYLNSALRELIAIRNKYRDLQELAIVMRAIDAVTQSVEA
jgi:hypothetical protein